MLVWPTVDEALTGFTGNVAESEELEDSLEFGGKMEHFQELGRYEEWEPLEGWQKYIFHSNHHL